MARSGLGPPQGQHQGTASAAALPNPRRSCQGRRVRQVLSRSTNDFEDLVANLATKTDKSAITRLARIDLGHRGSDLERVVADGLDPARLGGLVAVGVDEVSGKRRHKLPHPVTDHAAAKVVWGTEGKSAATLDEFFADLGWQRADELEAVSLDMGQGLNKSARQNALNSGRVPQRPPVDLHGECIDVTVPTAGHPPIDGQGRVVFRQCRRRGVLLLPGVGSLLPQRVREHPPGPSRRAGLVLRVLQPRASTHFG